MLLDLSVVHYITDQAGDDDDYKEYDDDEDIDGDGGATGAEVSGPLSSHAA